MNKLMFKLKAIPYIENKIRTVKVSSTLNDSLLKQGFHKKDKNRTCVYLHYYDKDICPFYIGCGNLTRAFAFTRSKRNEMWNNKVIDKTLVKVKIYAIDISKDRAESLEAMLIEEYKDSNILTNMSYGSGSKGIKYSNNKNSIPIVQLTLDDIFIKEYVSATEAADKLNFIASSITACCKHRECSYKNYKWEYLDEYYSKTNY